MSCYVTDVIKVAKNEVGYLEKASNYDLYSKTGNAGTKNYTKYAYEIDTKYPNFYNGKKNGYDWCDVFVDWCFITAYGVSNAKRLLCQPDHSLGAGCTYSYRYYKSKKQVGKTPEVGAQIFFGYSEDDLAHTGIVIDLDANYVWTIEGNTGSSVNEVKQKRYYRNYEWIFGYGYPDYDLVTENPDPEPAPTPSDKTVYIVQSGDTLSGIAAKYDTTVAALVKTNDIENPNLIFPGQKIVIPMDSQPIKETIYVVKSGDTLSEIAEKYNTTVTQLARRNKIANPNLIYPGQKLIIE